VRVYETATEEETIALGEMLARELLPRRGLVLVEGNLGAGKTTLVKGIARGLGACPPEEVSSPTFTLIHEYGDPVVVYHIDLYRLEEERETATLGLEELLDRDALVVVEWAEKFPRLWPEQKVEIRIERSSREQRLFTLTGA